MFLEPCPFCTDVRANQRALLDAIEVMKDRDLNHTYQPPEFTCEHCGQGEGYVLTKDGEAFYRYGQFRNLKMRVEELERLVIVLIKRCGELQDFVKMPT